MEQVGYDWRGLIRYISFIEHSIIVSCKSELGREERKNLPSSVVFKTKMSINLSNL